MRKLVAILFLSFLFADLAQAQAPGGQGAPGAKPGAPGGRPAGPPPSIGRAFGKVTDSAGQPVQATAVVLKSTTDPATKKKKLVLIKGMDTKANGEFNFEDLPIVQPLVVRISATGYKPQDVNFTIIPAAAQTTPGKGNNNPYGAIPSFEKDLGAVKLVTDVAQLATATVTAKTPPMKLELDKKVFNVAQNIVSAGGTGVDVMRNVPSVNVDIDGNLSLRGATPTIFIDGRPTTLTLDEIPADAIESVEVMTNPSAKYDASGGGAGIVNIILKKNRKQGYNGSVSAGFDSHGQPNALVGLSLRQNKVNFTLNGMYNGMNPRTIGTTDRTTILRDTTTHLYQSDLQRSKGHFEFGQVGMDWFVTNKTTLSASYIHVQGSFKPTDVSDIRTTIVPPVGDSSVVNSLRNSNNERTFNVNGVQTGMKHTFEKKGEEWTIDGSFFDVKSSLNSLYTTDYYTDPSKSTIAYTTRQLQTGTAAPSFYTFQTDYVNPLGEKTKLEAGLRTSIQKLANDNNTYTLDDKGDRTFNPLGVSDYTSTSNVYAAYVNFTSAIGNFGYALGLRGESSRYTGDLLNNDQHFKNSYPTALFPSIFLSQKMKHNQELQLSVTRKINRPGFFQLIPFTDYSDTLNITRGNPNLVPEFTYNTELTYMKTFPHNNTLLVSAYYKHTTNLITRYQDSGINPIGQPVLINTYENANNAYTVGGEITSTDNITKWWDISLNVNVYNSHINTENLQQASQAALWSWFGKFNSNFKIPGNFTVQLTAIYQSKTNLPINLNNNQFGPPGTVQQSSAQGYIKPYYGFDLAVKYSFLKQNAASITATMTDIFRNRWSDQFSSSPFFSQEFDRLKDPQLFRLVFSYRFGKMDLNLFKRKSMNGQGMGDAGSSMQQ
ncbi:outer membrane beta-barrel protein [Puia sp.]|uniref:outer membrane beta-barrel protein n=1 Tax=Puia sp. TaxID=2045100 RepID=UPI002F3F827D